MRLAMENKYDMRKSLSSAD